MKTITLFAVLLLSISAFGQSVENLLENGTLEAWNGESGAIGWHCQNVNAETEDVYEGNTSGIITGTGSIGQQLNFGSYNSQPDPGNYVVEGWCKVILEDEYAYLTGFFSWLNHDGLGGGDFEEIDFKNGYENWTKFSLTTSAPGWAYFFDYSISIESESNSNTIVFDDLKFYKGSTLSVSNPSNVEFRLFPNPTKNSVEIGLAEKGKVTIAVINVVGQKVMTTNKRIIDCSNFKSGVYFVEVTQNGKTSVKKLIVE